MSRRRRRPVEPWRQRALAQRQAERAQAPEPEPTPSAPLGPDEVAAGIPFRSEEPAGVPPFAASAEPSHGGPAIAAAEGPEPERTEPERTEPEQAEPEQAEPEQAEPEQADSDHAEREQAGPVAEPAPFGPPPVRPTPVGPTRSEPARRRARERRRGPRFNLITGTLLLSAVALTGGFLIVNLVLMPSFTRQGAEVRVPEVMGLSEREAERVLAAEDLRLSKISEQWSPDVPRGFISVQDPPPGGVVKRGRRISVVVSLGAQGTSVPVLDGNTERQAGIMLESAGLRRGKVAHVYTEEVGRDLVIASDPPGETLVEQETVVDLLVSLGPPPRGYVLPDLSGKDVSAVARGLRDEGFAVAVREGGPRQRSDAVSAQEPLPGHRIAPRDSVVLYYHP